MAAFYQPFVANRTTTADPATLFSTLRGLDPSVGIQHSVADQSYTLKKATVWTAGQIAAAQNVLDTCAPVTPQSIAQNEIDTWPISVKALVLTLIDQLNVLRAFHSLPAVTPAQALTAIRNKAGTL